MEMNKGRWAGIAGGIAVVALLAVAWMREPKSIAYETIEIPQPEGFAKFDYLQINDNGVVVGTLRGFDNQSDHLFLWDRQGGLTDLECPGFLPGRMTVHVIDINNRVQLIGDFGLYEHESNLQLGYPSSRGAFFYDPKIGFREIGTVTGIWTFDAIALNDQGQVVGQRIRREPYKKPEGWNFLWSPESGFQDLGHVGYPVDINNAGQVLGKDDLEKSYFLWSPEERKIRIPPLPDGDIMRGYVDEFGGITGLASERNKPNDVRIFRWDRQRGYYGVKRIASRTDREGYPIRAMNDQMMLFYEKIKPFDFFGLVKRPGRIQTIRLYTVGEGFRFPSGIPELVDPAFAILIINRNGWIVSSMDHTFQVMIPKGKAGRKKD
jgi:hypothetical protein